MSAEEGRARLARAVTGGFPEFAKLLSWLERAALEDVYAIEELLRPARVAVRFGITGPPGAGKSTLVGRLIAELRKDGKRVGVLAVDPSSPFSRGAILGDRIRYSEHFLDPGVFIRSLGTRGSLGGLSSAAFLMARAFDVCNFDVLLIETVGVGQTELDILHVADHVGVVLVPESGDSIQAMKAGLLEIADIYLVNKGDRPGADGLVREIQAQHEGDGVRPVLKLTATEGKGVHELMQWLLARLTEAPKDHNSASRLREEGRALLRARFDRDLETRVKAVTSLAEFQKLFRP